MATETRKITLTELGGDAGPNYSVFYSIDCNSYTQSSDCTNLYLPDVESFGYCTVDENTVCIKLVSKGTCINEVIENPTLPTTTTTTLAPTTTTTLAPTTTTTLSPTTSTTTIATNGPFQITAIQGEGQASSTNACALNVSWPFYTDETSVANVTIGSKIYSTSGGATWFGESEWYGIGTGIGTASVKAIRIDNSGNVIDVYTCGDATTTLAPTTTTAAPSNFIATGNYGIPGYSTVQYNVAYQFTGMTKLRTLNVGPSATCVSGCSYSAFDSWSDGASGEITVTRVAPDTTADDAGDISISVTAGSATISGESNPKIFVSGTTINYTWSVSSISDDAVFEVVIYEG